MFGCIRMIDIVVFMGVDAWRAVRNVDGFGMCPGCLGVWSLGGNGRGFKRVLCFAFRAVIIL